MIYNEVLLTRQIPSGNANRHIFCAAGNNKKVSKRRNRATGRRATLPPSGSAGFGYVFRMGVKMWVRQLPHILTHTQKCVFTTKKHRKPKFSMLSGAAGRIRTADLILTNCRRAFHPLLYKAFRRFLSKKDEVGNSLLHVFRPLVSPCGSRCGSAPQSAPVWVNFLWQWNGRILRCWKQ